ncbi:MAG: carbohydrate kinase family protein [Balneolales bacterium]
MSNPSTIKNSPSQGHEKASSDMVVIGELNMDLIMDKINNLPEIGKERIAENMTITLGSSSAILASNAATLGLQIAFTGRVGKDLFGKQILQILDDRDLDISNILVSEKVKTGLTCIYTSEGDRGMITYPGAMDELSIEDMNWEQVRSSKHLHMSSYYLQKGIRPDCAEIFKKAKSMGLSTSLDTNWDPDEKWGDDVYDVLKYVDVFLPNDAEALLISKKNNLDDAIKFLTTFGCTVVVTCGSEGIVVREGTTQYTASAIDVKPVDAVGAGDSFNAGFLSKYVKQENLEECLKFGMITGAFSTLEPGGTTAFQDMKHFNTFASQAHPVIKKMESVTG